MPAGRPRRKFRNYPTPPATCVLYYTPDTYRPAAPGAAPRRLDAGEPIEAVYNLGSGKSYAMARQKNDELEGYRKHHSEADLRAWLEPGGKHHHLVVEGGAWWRHWQMEVAKRDGDSVRLAELEAEQDRSVKELGPGLREAADKAGL